MRAPPSVVDGYRRVHPVWHWAVRPYRERTNMRIRWLGGSTNSSLPSILVAIEQRYTTGSPSTAGTFSYLRLKDQKPKINSAQESNDADFRQPNI